jgi:hypothetical protein
VLPWLLRCLYSSLSHSFLTDNDLILSTKETNIVANVNEKAVLPCRPTGNHVNMTLYKGEYPWSMKRVSASICAELNTFWNILVLYVVYQWWKTVT